MLRAAALLVCLLLTPVLAQDPAPGVSANPGAAELHRIDVQVVNKDGQPLAGLTADEFDVSLNGQPLPLASAAYVTPDAPAAVAGASSLIAPVEGRQFILAIDTASFSEEEAIGVGAAAQVFVDRLADTDRVGLVTFPDGPRMDVTADRDAVRQALETLPPHPAPAGRTRMQQTLDGLTAVLEGPAAAPGRKIVVLMTVTTKTADAAEANDVREAFSTLSRRAAEASAAVYTMVVGHGYLDMTVPQKIPIGTVGAPRAEDDVTLEARLAGLMGACGGALIKIAVAHPSLAVDRILLETSGYYVLAAPVRPGDPAGALPVSVRVKTDGAIVRARAWHAGRRTAAAAPPAGPPNAAASPTPAPAARRGRTVRPESIPGAYERGEYAAVRDRLAHQPDLARWIGDLRDDSPLWPAAPRRDAVFALDVAAVALELNDQPAREQAMTLLLRHAGDAASPPADAFHCAWFWAALTMIQTSAHADGAPALSARAIARCPDEPRLILADAIIADQAAPVLGPSVRTGAAAAAEAARHESVLERYRAARKFPDTAAEAQVREAWLLFRMKRFEEAAALTRSLPETTPDNAVGLQDDLDRQVQYIGHMVHGQALRDLGQFEPAAAAFRRALDVWPHAQAANLSLMTLLATHGQRGEAEQVAAAIEAAPVDAIDPWWWFWQGDRRLFSTLLERMRELAL